MVSMMCYLVLIQVNTIKLLLMLSGALKNLLVFLSVPVIDATFCVVI